MSNIPQQQSPNASEVVRIRFSSAMYGAIRKQAQVERRKITDMLRIIITDWFQRKGIKL